LIAAGDKIRNSNPLCSCLAFFNFDYEIPLLRLFQAEQPVSIGFQVTGDISNRFTVVEQDSHMLSGNDFP